MTKENQLVVSEYQAFMTEAKNEIMALNWEDIKAVYAPKADDKEFAVFLNTCQANVLDPRKKEAYFVKYGTAKGSTITGYQVYIKRADRTGKLNGWHCDTIRDGSKIVGAKCTIYRKDWEKPFEWDIDWSEFNKRQSTHNAMPGFMCKKICIAQAFRLCFPDEVGSLPYTSEELSTFADEGTSKQALNATSNNAGMVDVSDKVEVSKPKPKAKAKVKKAATPAPKKEEPVDPPEPDKEPEEKKEETPALLSDATKGTIISTFEGLNIRSSLIESVLGTPHAKWNEAHKEWLLERYHELEDGTLDAKGFAALEMQ